MARESFIFNNKKYYCKYKIINNIFSKVTIKVTLDIINQFFSSFLHELLKIYISFFYKQW